MVNSKCDFWVHQNNLVVLDILGLGFALPSILRYTMGALYHMANIAWPGLTNELVIGILEYKKQEKSTNQ
jgi:hypothetical protein